MPALVPSGGGRHPLTVLRSSSSVSAMSIDGSGPARPRAATAKAAANRRIDRIAPIERVNAGKML